VSTTGVFCLQPLKKPALKAATVRFEISDPHIGGGLEQWPGTRVVDLHDASIWRRVAEGALLWPGSKARRARPGAGTVPAAPCIHFSGERQSRARRRSAARPGSDRFPVALGLGPGSHKCRRLGGAPRKRRAQVLVDAMIVDRIDRDDSGAVHVRALLCVLWVSSGESSRRTSQKKESLDPAAPRSFDHVVLNPEIAEQKIHRLGLIGLDAAHLGRRQEDKFRAGPGEKGVHGVPPSGSSDSRPHLRILR